MATDLARMQVRDAGARVRQSGRTTRGPTQGSAGADPSPARARTDPSRGAGNPAQFETAFDREVARQRREREARNEPDENRFGPVGVAPDGPFDPDDVDGNLHTFPDLHFKREGDSERQSGDEGSRSGRIADPGTDRRSSLEPAVSGPGHSGSRNASAGSTDDVRFPGGSGSPPLNADVDRFVERLYREFERRMRIERERRGL